MLTKGRTIFGVGRGYHTREVETFGAPMLDQNANRELFEEQVEIIFKAFDSERFSHQGKHYTLPPRGAVSRLRARRSSPWCRGRSIGRSNAGSRWSAPAPRGLDFMVKHGIKGAVGGGAATMEQGPIAAYQDAAARAGKDWKLGENLMIGIVIHLADTREQAIKEMTPLYEEHVKMFAPLGFVPGMTKEQVAAVARRGGWYGGGRADGGALHEDWADGSPARRTSWWRILKNLEARYPGHGARQPVDPIGHAQGRRCSSSTSGWRKR